MYFRVVCWRASLLFRFEYNLALITMPAIKFGSKNKYKGKYTRKRKAHNASIRELKKRKTGNVESFIGDIETAVLGMSPM